MTEPRYKPPEPLEDPATAELRAAARAGARADRKPAETLDEAVGRHVQDVTEFRSEDARIEALEQRAYGFAPDERMERILEQRAKDPDTFDSFGSQTGLEVALYADKREAHIELRKLRDSGKHRRNE